MSYIATFHSLFGAMSFKKKIQKLGGNPVLMPVPRALSSSCGTCVRFDMEFDEDRMYDEDMERVAREDGDNRYTIIFEAPEM